MKALSVLIIAIVCLTLLPPTHAQDDDERPTCTSELITLYTEAASQDLKTFAQIMTTLSDYSLIQISQLYLRAVELHLAYQDVESNATFPECVLGVNRIMVVFTANNTFTIGLFIAALNDTTNVDNYVAMISLLTEINVELNEALLIELDTLQSQVE